jgi:hypothetical protein
MPEFIAWHLKPGDEWITGPRLIRVLKDLNKTGLRDAYYTHIEHNIERIGGSNGRQWQGRPFGWRASPRALA